MNTSPKVENKQENAFLNLVFNILLPVLILNQLSKKLDENGPLVALIVALAFPIGYGIYDFVTRNKTNYISVLGVVSVAFTGGFALFELSGIWFAVKEAFFPLMIGVAVYVSNKLSKPLLKTLFWNPSVFNIEKIEQNAMRSNQISKLESAFMKASHMFAISFIISAILNFLLAIRIFKPIDATLPPPARSEVLNQQIAEMTWQGYVVIALPMTLFMGFMLWYLLKKIKQITGLNLEEIMVQDKPHSSSPTS